MDFFTTAQMAREARSRLHAAGDALLLPRDFTELDRYGTGEREDFGQYLLDWGIQFFSLREVITPNQPRLARQAGYTELVPPLHLWPWALLVLVASDTVRAQVGRPVVMRNLYRPMPYNKLVASSGIRSDHPNAAAADLDFRSADDRREAEDLLRELSASHPELEMSLGLGARSIHLGILSPKGHRHWFYASYTDPRIPLGARDVSDDDTDPVGGGADPSDGGAGPGDDGAPDGHDVPDGAGPVGAALDEETRLRVIEQVAVHESGGTFDALNRDGEFEGRFDRPGDPHPASGTYHIGLSYGVIQFTQDSGSLGAVLEEMRRRDTAAFEEIFGPAADRLVEVTTARGPTSSASRPRGARVQPVDGADLWEEPWTDRFRRAGHHPPFQQAQLEVAAREYLDPMLPFCHWLDLTTDRALTIVVDRAVQQGRGGARRWIMASVGPITDRSMLADVLDRYGFASVRELQQAVPGMDDDGIWGPSTHAGLCWFERQRGDDEPFVVHVPDREKMLDMMVAASRGERWGHRVERLRSSPDFEDVPLALMG